MSEQKIRVLAARLARAVNPPEQREAIERTRSSFDGSGNLVPTAGRTTVPVQNVAFYVPGVLTVGNNRAMEYVVPEKCRVLRFGGRVRVASVTAQIMTRITVNGSTRWLLNIPAGSSGAAFPTASASTFDAQDIVRIDITQVGAAASPGTDLTVYLFVQSMLE